MTRFRIFFNLTGFLHNEIKGNGTFCEVHDLKFSTPHKVTQHQVEWNPTIAVIAAVMESINLNKVRKLHLEICCKFVHFGIQIGK